MGTRTRAREMALQALYFMDMRQDISKEMLDLFCRSFTPHSKTMPFFLQLSNGVMESIEEIDSIIERHSSHWRLGRMTCVDRNIIRVAVYEILYCDDIPSKVSINEAVNIGKRFGTGESGSFINGILDSIRAEEKKIPYLVKDRASNKPPEAVKVPDKIVPFPVSDDEKNSDNVIQFPTGDDQKAPKKVVQFHRDGAKASDEAAQPLPDDENVPDKTIPIPPEIRILPMDVAGEFENWPAEKTQNDFFLKELTENNGKYRYKKRGMKAAPGTIVLFQYEAGIIALAELRRIERFPEPESGDYHGAFYFDPSTIKVFEPLTQDAMRSVFSEDWEDRDGEWHEKFDKFGRSMLYLEPEKLPELYKKLRETKISRIPE